jgi:UPF0716 protein FxsA
MGWFLRRSLLIAWPIVEILLIWYVAGLIGWGWMLLILFGGIVAAFLVLQAAGRNVMEVLSRPRSAGRAFTAVDPQTGATTTLYEPPAASTEDQVRADELTVRESGLLLTAAALLAVPGLLSDAAGLVLLIPPVRRTLARRFAARRSAPVTIIRGETVSGPGTEPPAGPAGGTIIRGEILPPPEEPNG